MRKNRNILLFLIIIFIITGCKKYDDGPTISFRSKKARVVGKWVTEKWIVDKYELTYILDYDRTAEFTKDGIYRFHESDPLTLEETNLEGTWDFRSEKEQLILGLPTGRDNSMNYVLWDIIRLKNKELWLEMVDYSYPNSDIYEWRLKAE
jgi:hypothetical protein